MRREIGTYPSSAEHAHNRDRLVLSDSALRWAARRGACPYRPGRNWPRRRPILRWLGAHMFCTRSSSFSTTWLRFSARIRSVSKCRRAWEEEKEVRRPETGGVRFDPGEIGRIRISAVTAWAWRLQNFFRTFSGFSKDSDLVDQSCSRHFWGAVHERRIYHDGRSGAKRQHRQSIDESARFDEHSGNRSDLPHSRGSLLHLVHDPGNNVGHDRGILGRVLARVYWPGYVLDSC